MAGYVDPIMKEVGLRIRQMRKSRGMTQQQLADQADLPYSYMSEVESGKHNISIELLYRIADALRVSWTELQPYALDIFSAFPPEYMDLFRMSHELPPDQEKMIITMFTAQIQSLKKQ